MAYQGVSVPIILGQVGLVTDDPINALPINALSKANNVTFQNGRLSKMQGSAKLNSVALSADIVALTDYWPTSSLQRTICLTSDGKMFRDSGDGTFTSQTAIKSGLGVLTTDSVFVTGGQESTGRSKKLFALTGVSQIQVLNGDSSAPAPIAFPSPDWETGNFPSFGIQYSNRFCVIGSAADKHRAYFSTISDHENFVGQTFNTNRWELWQLIAGGDTDGTASVQAGTATTIYNTTTDDGFMVQGVGQFNKVTMTVSQAHTGTPVYSYQYWTGAIWSPLTLSTTAPDFSTTGAKSLEFNIPSNWAIGDGTEGGNNLYYSIRGIATTAPATAVKITALSVINTNSDFAPPTFPIFPGEGDGLITAYVYRGLLFLFKRPFGVYIIDGRDPDTANWTVTKFSDAFGAASPNAALQILGDLVVANSMGTLTSLQASQKFGDFDAGDVLQNAKVEEYIRDEINFTGLPFSQAVYYPEKKIALFTGQSSTNPVRDRMIAIDVARDNPRVYLIDKDRPNCLTLRKDSQGISRPMYGSADGFVYLMDQLTYNVAGLPFLGEFQTAYTDFGQIDQGLAGKNKIFDFLEVSYLPTGNNDFFVDVYVDGSYRQTLTFSQTYGVELDAFVLDVDELTGTAKGGKNRKPLYSCTGNKISFRVYNNNSNEAFQIERFIVSFRMSGEQIYAGQV